MSKEQSNTLIVSEMKREWDIDILKDDIIFQMPCEGKVMSFSDNLIEHHLCHVAERLNVKVKKLNQIKIYVVYSQEPVRNKERLISVFKRIFEQEDIEQPNPMRERDRKLMLSVIIYILVLAVLLFLAFNNPLI